MRLWRVGPVRLAAWRRERGTRMLTLELRLWRTFEFSVEQGGIDEWRLKLELRTWRNDP